MKKGSITITLSFLVVILLSLFLTILNGIQMRAIEMRTSMILEMGMDSIFAEYNRELLEQYNLFYIDASYGSENRGIDAVSIHLRSMMEKNIRVPESLSSADLIGFTVEDIEPISYHIASDFDGYSVREQAISYQKDTTGISVIEYILNEFEVMKYFNLDSRNIKEEQRQLEAQASTSLPSEYGFQINHMLTFFGNELGTISEVELDLTQSTFYRMRDIGVYKEADIPTSSLSVVDMAEEILFQEYLFDHCSYYGNELDKSHLKYQMEYIIAGGSSDAINLNAILTALFAIREVSNFIHLIGDQEKTNIVKVVSTSVAAVLFIPSSEPILRLLLQGIWATYESSLDIKALIKGEKVPLLKSDATWKSDFGEGLSFSPVSNNQNDSTGLSYKEYLHLLLILTNSDEKVYRFMDVVELDIQQTEYNEKFLMDSCIDYIEMQVDFLSSIGYRRTWLKKYQYGI
ncbi:MAG: DUF5702 domain-containing protein [Eubacteriales bacterium]